MASWKARSNQLAATMFLALAACGGTDGLTAEPGDPGAGGRAGSGGTTTVGVGSGPSVTTVGVGSGSSSTVGAGGAGGWATTTSGTGGAATGGAGGSQSICIPGRSIGCTCVNGASGAQVCLAEGTYGACLCAGMDGGTWEQQQLARLRRGIVGTWEGIQTNPWYSGCPTTITFEANGHYSAHSPGESCTAFYYGSNQDSREKTYLLNNVLPTAEGEGEIVFWFGPGSTNLGRLRHLVLSNDENLLEFQAWKGEYGPLVFTLKRVSRGQ